MKFYILGSSGFLGGGCVSYLRNKEHEVLAERIELTDLPLLRKKFFETKPDVVINFAGVRAYPNVDWCENNKEATVRVNVAGAINAMLAALNAGAYPIQIASGCIYLGGPETPFTEEDEPNFFGSFYSRMKIVLQTALRELPVLQARIRMPISTRSHPRNLINKLISYKKIISVPNSITLIEDLFPALENLSKTRPVGILNLTNNGYIKHEEILNVYKKVINPNHYYNLVSMKELNDTIKAQRSNCVLENTKAKSLNINMPALDNNRLENIMRIYKS